MKNQERALQVNPVNSNTFLTGTREGSGLLLRNGRIIDPASGRDQEGDCLILDGKIAETGSVSHTPDACRVIDLQGKWIVPGLIDMHVHLREPGEEYKETIESGTRAAAAGGFTGVACMPNTRPVNDSSGITSFILERAAAAGHSRVWPVASITRGLKGEELTEFGDLLQKGAIAFSDDGLPVKNSAVMRLALDYARNFNALIISHSEEPDLAAGGVMNEGTVSTRLGLKGIPAAGEHISIFRDVAIAELTGSRLHVAHISTAGGVEIIRQAKARGVKVTAETAPHYFSLTEEAVEGYNTFAKMNPPLRTEADRQAIIEGLRDGTLDVIATDHAPHSTLEKECEFALAMNGITGLETSLPLSLELVRQGHLSPMEMIRRMSTAPASILGVSGGNLTKGTVADVTVIDPETEWTVTREGFQSKSHNSPFTGMSVKGRAELTIVAGRVVHSAGNP
jgi:dihydroorotase